MLTMMFMIMLSAMLPIMIYSMSMILYMKSSSDRMKMTPFECGFDSVKSSRIPFSTRFFLLAVLFIVFDVEIVLILPFPIMMKSNMSMGLIMTFMFILMLLLLGVIHEWNEGSLNWNN